jgi:hypothetical protein
MGFWKLFCRSKTPCRAAYRPSDFAIGVAGRLRAPHENLALQSFERSNCRMQIVGQFGLVRGTRLMLADAKAA